jgi:hypothetical protein
MGEGTPDTGTATSLRGSEDEALAREQFLASFNEDTQQLFRDKGYKNVDDLGKAYKELSSKLGEKTLAPPDPETGTQEDWDAFYSKMGRPETPEGYAYKLPEGLPETTPYDADFASQFKTWSHEAGLSPKQSAQLHDHYMTHIANQLQVAAQATATRVSETHQAIMDKWGPPETEAYKRNVTLASRAVKHLELQGPLEEAGLLNDQGMVTNATMAFALARVGQKMFAEDNVFSGPGTAPYNPFSDKSSNMTQQSVLIKNDPQRALTLIRAAGKNPKDFGFSAAG